MFYIFDLIIVIAKQFYDDKMYFSLLGTQFYYWHKGGSNKTENCGTLKDYYVAVALQEKCLI